MKENKSKNQSLLKKHIFTLIRPFKKNVLLFFITLIISSFLESFGFAMLFPLFELIMGGETNHQLSKALLYPLQLVGVERDLINISIFIMVIILFKSLFYLFKTYYSHKICFDIRRSMMEDISDYYLTARYSNIIVEKQGVLINNLVHEPHKATAGMMKLSEFLISLFMVIFYYGILLLTNYKITFLISIVSAILYFFFSRVSKNILQRYGEEELAFNQEISSIGAESISALRQIKTFGIKGIIEKKLRKNIKGLTNVGIKYVLFQSIPRITIELLIFSGIISTIIVLYSISFDLLVSVIPVLTLFVIISQKLFSNLTRLISTKTSLNYYFPSIDLIVSILDKRQLINPVNTKNLSKLKSLETDICFDNISFSYNGKDLLFENITFSIPKGKTTAIIGESGAGKSTITDLILGLYFPTSGVISFNGLSINDVNINDWRKKFGFVSQDNFLFHNTIMENIRFGNLEASDEIVIQAAKQANAHVFISEFPEGYETVVGDRGMLISGGQKQRIAIARALIRDPEILIFDEATNALDYKTEQSLQREIFKISKGKTVLIISHRLETVKNADNILKIENGKISKINSQDIHKFIH